MTIRVPSTSRDTFKQTWVCRYFSFFQMVCKQGRRQHKMHNCVNYTKSSAGRGSVRKRYPFEHQLEDGVWLEEATGGWSLASRTWPDFSTACPPSPAWQGNFFAGSTCTTLCRTCISAFFNYIHTLKYSSNICYPIPFSFNIWVRIETPITTLIYLHSY